MATSPIYGWPEPDNSSLVKNGAQDMRALGDAIDTTMATMIPKSLIAAKGDLVAASANDTPAILSVGSNGETLVADSSTSTGLRWQGDYAAGKNKIINGDFGIWQRGTSFTGSPQYTADRFQTYSDSTATISQQTFTPGTAPIAGYEGTYFLRSARTSGGTYGNIKQAIEDVRTFAGQTITVSFWAKSSASQAITIRPAQLFGTGGSATVVVTGQDVNATTSWARYNATFSIPSVSGKTIGPNSSLTVEMYWLTSAAITMDIWGIQVEAGSVATAFQTATGTIQGELAACQRYYHRFTGGGVGDSLIGSGLGFSTTVAMFVWNLGTTMRTAPSAMDLSNQGIYRPANATGYSGGTWSLNQGFDNSVRVIYTHGSAIFTAGESLIPSSTSATNYIGFSAEL